MEAMAAAPARPARPMPTRAERLALQRHRLQYHLARLRHARIAAVPEAAAATPCFFVVGHGRSGTTYLARLLGAAENALVLHEPDATDGYAAHLARIDRAAAEEYVRRFRGPMIGRRQARSGREIYGEVNSRLRLHVESLSAFLPNARIFVLERELHEVVRSLMSRNLWMLHGFLRHKPETPDVDPVLRALDLRRLLRAEPELARLALATWYVLRDRATYRARAGTVLRFERVVAEPSYVARHLVEPLGLRLPQTRLAASERPENATARHAMPAWRDWTPRQRAVFEAVASSMPAAA